MAKQWLNSLHVGSNPIQHIITLIGILARYYQRFDTRYQMAKSLTHNTKEELVTESIGTGK